MKREEERDGGGTKGLTCPSRVPETGRATRSSPEFRDRLTIVMHLLVYLSSYLYLKILIVEKSL